MTNNTPEPDFSALWQQQPVSEIDLADVTRRLKHQKWLQRWYVVSDLTGFLIGLGALLYSWQEISLFMAVVLSGVMVCGGAFTGYIIWLRRHALLASFSDTNQYRETLKKQYLSNQKIARVTLHSSWSGVVIMVLVWAVAGLMGEVTWQRFVDNGGIVTLLVVCMLMAGFGLWAYKREQKFKAEYEQLVSQEQNDLWP
ncbi:hypothetical protein [Alteromonas lipolytica]|uniref:Uncharacterized protein n=1 Tax=Alteromonas lipolytica TaxID=1856405 RepID=A0A1E8FAK7_9ALTE|nr:hypothetical protein [Alteromonas lipolytica]OFI32967.1 hypothetical protein BFC17_01435 [Alteromonas lipolytica]GGF63838.1 hypothetical protein GCM10011338_15210 [Alteromonas lipolytica]